MKKIILTFIIAASATFGFSQTFEVTADTMESTHTVDEYPADYNFVENTSGAELTLSFDLLTNTIPANGWDVTLCTQALCLPSIPSTAVLGTFADGEQGYFNTHVSFNGFTGTGEISFKVYETSNPANADTIVFIYHAVEASSIDEANNLSITTYPNPATDLLNINGLDDLDNAVITIYSLSGALVQTEQINTNISSVFVNNLENGIYLIEIKENDAVVYFSKFTKQ